MRLRRSVAPLLAAVIASAASLAAPTVVIAQAAPDLALRLVSQPMTVAANGDLPVVLAVDGELPADAEIVVTTYQLAANRQAVRTAIESGGGIANDLLRYPVASIPRDADGNLLLTIGTETDPGDANRLRLRNAGLYPMSIDVRVGDGGPLASIVTFVERTGDPPPEATIGVTAALTLDAAPSLQPTGQVQVSADVRARLDALITLLEQSAVPLTVSVRPEILDSLSQSADPADAERIQRLDAAIDDRHELLVAPYISMNPGTSLAAGMQDTFTEELRSGEDVLADATPNAVLDRSTWAVIDGLDIEGVSFLRDLGVRQLLIDDKALASTPERPGSLAAVRSSENERIPALVADAAFETAFTAGGGDDSVLTAHQLAAEVIATAIEQEQILAFDPNFPPRALTLTVGASDDIDHSLFVQVGSLLAESDRVDATTASTQLRVLERGTPDDLLDEVRTTPMDPTETIQLADLINRVNLGVETTIPMLPPDDPRPERWRSLVRLLPADNQSDRQRRSYVFQLDGEVGDVRSSVTVQEQSGTVNLGGRKSSLPLTLVNTSPTPLKVAVRLTSPGPKLSFPEGDQVVEVFGRMRIEVPVESRTNGRSPVTVQLLTPEGGSPLTPPEQFTVQATALTGLGQVVTAAFVLILVSWWISHARRARRRAREEQSAASQSRHPARPPEPTTAMAVPPQGPAAAHDDG